MRINFKFKFASWRTYGKLNEGVTLIEMLLYMGLLSIFLGVLTSLFTAVLDTHLESRSTSSVEQDGRYIINRFMYDVARASLISVPATESTTPESILHLTINGESYEYSLNGNNLQLQTPSSTDQLNSYATVVSNFSVVRRGNGSPTGKDSITVSFRIESTTERTTGNETRDFSTTITQR